MSTILGLSQLSQEEFQFNIRNDRRIVYDAVQTYMQFRMEASRAAMGFFVERDEDAGRIKYQLPMTGIDEPVRSDGTPNTLTRFGSWNVGFPLFTYKPQLGLTPVADAYLTAQELQTHIDGVLTRFDNTKRNEILKRLFNNTQTTYVDPENTLPDETVEPVANGDSVLYYPVLGATVEAQENHYLTSGYASAAIDDTNNPVREILVPELIEHFGRMTGGSNIAVLINDDERDVIEALAGFVPVSDNYVTEGDDTDLTTIYPANMPGEVIGRVNGATVAVWDWIPSGYMVARHMDAPAPLIQRVDAAAYGLGGGNLVNLNDHTEREITFNKWRYRFGIGTGNRLNAVVLELTADASYDVPAVYA